MSATLPLNSPEAIQERFTQKRFTLFGPMLMVIARPALALAAQGIALAVMTALNVQNAAVVVRNWWSVYGTIADVGCIGLLLWLTRREGIRLRDLIGFVKSKLKLDIPLGIGIVLVVFPITVFAFGQVAMYIAYGSANPVFPEGTFIRTLPLVAALYSRILWWPIWSVTEEMTYDGYALPRFYAITKSKVFSVAIVSFFYALQHGFLPLVNAQHMFYMFILFIPLAVSMTCIYMRVRRLTPLIIGHWMMDLFSTLFMIQIV